jgi:hypothetical protein
MNTNIGSFIAQRRARASPPGAGEMRDFWLQTVLGVLFESALTAARFAFSGLFAHVPDLKLVVPHIGGSSPTRLDASTSRRASTWKTSMSTRMPLRLRCWPTPSGAGGRTMLGSDYSQAMGDLAGCVADVEALDISEGEKNDLRRHGAETTGLRFGLVFISSTAPDRFFSRCTGAARS